MNTHKGFGFWWKIDFRNGKMTRKIRVFGREFQLQKLLVYAIFVVVFSVYSFVQRPFIKSEYLKSDIEYFEDNYFWKIYLFIAGIFLIFLLIKVRKSKELMGEVCINLILFFTFTYIFFNSFITTQALFINQIKSIEKKIVVYNVFNRDKLISLIDDTKEKSRIDIFDKEIIKKIEDKRKMNHQKPLNQIKHGDTIHVNFSKGLFGFKYLN